MLQSEPSPSWKALQWPKQKKMLKEIKWNGNQIEINGQNESEEFVFGCVSWLLFNFSFPKHFFFSVPNQSWFPCEDNDATYKTWEINN